MNKDFDFNKIGKRLPYTTPDGFFDKLEDDIWKEVNTVVTPVDTPRTTRRTSKLRLVMRSAIAVAAAIALMLIINMKFSKPAPATLTDVDMAFSQLSESDQAYLLNIYGDDVFINE